MTSKMWGAQVVAAVAHKRARLEIPDGHIGKLIAGMSVQRSHQFPASCWRWISSLCFGGWHAFIALQIAGRKTLQLAPAMKRFSHDFMSASFFRADLHGREVQQEAVYSWHDNASSGTVLHQLIGLGGCSTGPALSVRSVSYSGEKSSQLVS